MSSYAQLYSPERIDMLMKKVNLVEAEDAAPKPYYRVGIDIGSTSSRAVVMDKNTIVHSVCIPTGLNSADAAKGVLASLEEAGYVDDLCAYAATGRGRLAASFANKIVSSSACHGKGAHYLYREDGVVIDAGSQETQVTVNNGGKSTSFAVNDRCSAAIGRFLEIIATRLNLTQEELQELARKGNPSMVSSRCMVFLESEIANLVAQGTSTEDIAWIIYESVAQKITSVAPKVPDTAYMLTGGLCENAYLVERISAQLGVPVMTHPQGAYAGAIGAALHLPSKRPAE